MLSRSCWSKRHASCDSRRVVSGHITTSASTTTRSPPWYARIESSSKTKPFSVSVSFVFSSRRWRKSVSDDSVSVSPSASSPDRRTGGPALDTSARRLSSTLSRIFSSTSLEARLPTSFETWSQACTPQPKNTATAMTRPPKGSASLESVEARLRFRSPFFPNVAPEAPNAASRATPLVSTSAAWSAASALMEGETSRCDLRSAFMNVTHAANNASLAATTPDNNARSVFLSSGTGAEAPRASLDTHSVATSAAPTANTAATTMTAAASSLRAPTGNRGSGRSPTAAATANRHCARRSNVLSKSDAATASDLARKKHKSLTLKSAMLARSEVQTGHEKAGGMPRACGGARARRSARASREKEKKQARRNSRRCWC